MIEDKKFDSKPEKSKSYEPVLGKSMPDNSKAYKSEAKVKKWRNIFSVWSPQVWSAARAVMQEAAGSAAFGANTMREEWKPVRCPSGGEEGPYDQNTALKGWQTYAADAVFPQSPL